MYFAIVHQGFIFTAAAPFKINTLSMHRQQLSFCLHPSVCLHLHLLTYFGHFGYRRLVGSIQKPWLIVVDVLDLYDELGLRLQRPVRQAVAGLSTEDVLGLHLPVQPLDGVDVPRAVIDGEGGAGALACQDVLNGAVAFIHV